MCIFKYVCFLFNLGNLFIARLVSLLLESKMGRRRRRLRKIWICTDVWMDMFPFFDRPQLGLKLALLSPRFDVLVDKYFDGKSELPIWRPITIRKDSVAKVPKLRVLIDANSVEFPLPDHSLHNKIRFEDLYIDFIDHSVITFLRSNQQIWDKGTNLDLWMPTSYHIYVKRCWKVLVNEIWPIFAPNIHNFSNANWLLYELRRLISPTILTDLNPLNSILSGNLLPDSIADDGPNATRGQALSKWLHTPRTDGQLNRLFCGNYPILMMDINKWIINFKEAFLRATNSSASYKICLELHESTIETIDPFELINERTSEKLTFEKEGGDRGNANFVYWLLKRCQIGETATINWEDEKTNNLNIVKFNLDGDDGDRIGRLSPPKAADKMNTKSRPKKKSKKKSAKRSGKRRKKK